MKKQQLAYLTLNLPNKQVNPLIRALLILKPKRICANVPLISSLRQLRDHSV
jgi:hypothetical protein